MLTAQAHVFTRPKLCACNAHIRLLRLLLPSLWRRRRLLLLLLPCLLLLLYCYCYFYCTATATATVTAPTATTAPPASCCRCYCYLPDLPAVANSSCLHCSRLLLAACSSDEYLSLPVVDDHELLMVLNYTAMSCWQFLTMLLLLSCGACSQQRGGRDRVLARCRGACTGGTRGRLRVCAFEVSRCPSESRCGLLFAGLFGFGSLLRAEAPLVPKFPIEIETCRCSDRCPLHFHSCRIFRANATRLHDPSLRSQ